MGMETFLYPIVDSGYFFEFTLSEAKKEPLLGGFALRIKYSLKNGYSIPFEIPIVISHIASLNCKEEQDFDNDKSQAIMSRSVVDLQNNEEMYGYGDDHHVQFEPQETKEFLILFELSALID